LKYKYKVGDGGQWTEEYKPDPREHDNHITMPCCEDKWKFHEFFFKDTGCPSVTIEEGEKFTIWVQAVERGQLKFHYVET
jgi:hypothetical protein